MYFTVLFPQKNKNIVFWVLVFNSANGLPFDNYFINVI